MKLVQKVTGGIFASSLIFFSGTVVVFAQDWLPDTGGTMDDNLLGWVHAILMFLVGLASLLAVAILIFNGIKYMTASGDEQKIQSATTGITWAVVGLVVAGIAWLIVNFVINRVIQIDQVDLTYVPELVSRVLG